MPRRCSVYGCRSNYDGEDKATTFSLPSNEVLRSKWLKKIPTDFSKLKQPIVCIKHFAESDIVRNDVVRVNGELKVFPRERLKLVENAVPTIFPNTPQYLSQTPSCVKRLADVEESRMELAISESIEMHKEYMERDKLFTLDDIVLYVANCGLSRRNWSCVKLEEKLFLSMITVENDSPVIFASIIVSESLHFEVKVRNVKVSEKDFSMKSPYLNSRNALENLMAGIESKEVLPQTTCKFEFAISILKSMPLYEELRSFRFLVEQLIISQRPKNLRKYCNQTMVLASCLYVHSPSAYNALLKCGLMFLPHQRNLQKLISHYNLPNSTLDSASYLKGRLQNLTETEKVVCLEMDEIYIQPQLTFKGGKIYGSSHYDCEQSAKSALVFMVSSVMTQYRDVVCIIPIHKLSGELLKTMTLSVLKKVEEVGFIVLALVSDNHSMNRKAFKLICPNNQLTSKIVHPFDSSRFLFFAFDTVHILKCIRNCWERKKTADRAIKFPNWNDRNSISCAKYKHLESMFNMEKNSLVKYGHTLSLKALYPTSIQKQNVNLALKIFHENNVTALNHISKDHPQVFEDVLSTAGFIDIIVKWWKICNVKGVLEGKRFNDPYREAITENTDFSVNFLRDFLSWVRIWKASIPTHDSLSSETLLSLIITTETFLSVIPYLFERYDFKYILLSRFQNDNLESRFSSYRQLSGANYYLSYVQLLENERKLRFRNDVIFCAQNGDVHLNTLMPVKDNSDEDIDVGPFSAILETSFELELVPDEILPILTYIAGFAVLRTLRRGKCTVCSSWLLLNKEVDVELDTSYNFLKDCDRSKLSLPTEVAIYATSVTWYVMSQLTKNYLREFCACKSQLSVLSKLASIFLDRDSFTSEECDCKFTLLRKLRSISETISKILINNFVKNANDRQDESKLMARKVKKLKI